MSEAKQKSVSAAAAYPTREEHNRRWEELAREIAADRKAMAENPELASQNKKGSLIILGSGIQGIGFTREAEAYLKVADKVFYCVSNPPSQIWLHQVRPDAYDLYVLYNDTKPRFNTYMQMSEAMLHYVRKGLRVVGVYYGHPGIFVLSTHRAIAINRIWVAGTSDASFGNEFNYDEVAKKNPIDRSRTRSDAACSSSTRNRRQIPGPGRTR